MFTVSLLEPQIPQNTGNIGRLCGATRSKLDIVGNIGFKLSDRHLKRSGLDYWEFIQWEYHQELDQYIDSLIPEKVHLLTTKVGNSYAEHQYSSGDFLLFGSETKGTPQHIMDRFSHRLCTIPMMNKNIRSLNLGNSVSIVLYEALRQTGGLSK